MSLYLYLKVIKKIISLLEKSKIVCFCKVIVEFTPEAEVMSGNIFSFSFFAHCCPSHSFTQYCAECEILLQKLFQKALY